MVRIFQVSSWGTRLSLTLSGVPRTKRLRPRDSDHLILVVPDSLDYANGILKGAGNKASPFFQPTKK